jgi:hypothetical protein
MRMAIRETAGRAGQPEKTAGHMDKSGKTMQPNLPDGGQ